MSGTKRQTVKERLSFWKKSVKVQQVLDSLWQRIPRVRQRADAAVLRHVALAAARDLGLRPIRQPIDADWSTPTRQDAPLKTFLIDQCQGILFSIVDCAFEPTTEMLLNDKLQSIAILTSTLMRSVVVDPVWQREVDGTWTTMDDSVSVVLEQRFASGSEFCLLDLDEGGFVVDFDDFTISPELNEAEDENVTSPGSSISITARKSGTSSLRRKALITTHQRQERSLVPTSQPQARGVIHVGSVPPECTPLWSIFTTAHSADKLRKTRRKWQPLSILDCFVVEEAYNQWKKKERINQDSDDEPTTPTMQHPIFAVTLGNKVHYVGYDMVLGATLTVGDYTVPLQREVNERGNASRVLAVLTKEMPGPSNSSPLSMPERLLWEHRSTPFIRAVLAGFAFASQALAAALVERYTTGRIALPDPTRDFVVDSTATKHQRLSMAITDEAVPQLQLISSLVLDWQVSVDTIRIHGFHPIQSHEWRNRTNWVPCEPLNEWLWQHQYHSLLIAGRWCPLHREGMAVMVDGCWRWISPQGHRNEYLRFYCRDEPLTVKKHLFNKSAYPRQFVGGQVEVHLDLEPTRVRKAFNLLYALLHPIAAERENTPFCNLSLNEKELMTMQLIHVYSFFGIKIAGCVDGIKVEAVSKKQEELSDNGEEGTPRRSEDPESTRSPSTTSVDEDNEMPEPSGQGSVTETPPETQEKTEESVTESSVTVPDLTQCGSEVRCGDEYTGTTLVERNDDGTLSPPEAPIPSPTLLTPPPEVALVPEFSPPQLPPRTRWQVAASTSLHQGLFLLTECSISAQQQGDAERAVTDTSNQCPKRRSATHHALHSEFERKSEKLKNMLPSKYRKLKLKPQPKSKFPVLVPVGSAGSPASVASPHRTLSSSLRKSI